MPDEDEQRDKPFATVKDLEARWSGHYIADTDMEEHAETILADASDLIRTYPGHRRCGAATLKRICCAVARRYLEAEEQDLSNVTNLTETVGPVSHSYAFGTASGDLRLWPSEEKQLGVGRQRAWSIDPLTGESRP